jgi:AcrR family transcriptional regulator
MKIRVARKPEDAYQHGNLREALVQAGLRLLSEGGLENLSLRAAAQLAGVSHAAPYRHFRDKNALVAAIAEKGFRLLTARMQEEEQRCESRELRARLSAIGVGYVAFAIEHPGYFRVIFGGLACADPSTPELQEAGEASYRVLRDLIVEGIESQVLVARDPDELALASWALVHGLGMLAIDGALEPRLSGATAFKLVAESLTRLLQEGMIHRTP